MKKTLFSVLAIACLFSACSKDDKTDETPPVETEWLLDHIIRDEDTVRLTYHTDGTVKQFARYSSNGGWNDSTRLEYTNGRITKFLLMEADGTTRIDRAFVYNGEQLARIDYYNFVSGTEVEVTDHDSIVYKDGKLAECHRINGTFRNSFSKYTWENGNIVKEELFSVINDQPVPDAITTYTYSDKPGLSISVKSNFIFFFSQGDYTYLSLKALVKAETRHLPADVLAVRRTIEYTYNADGLLSKTVVTGEDLAENETTQLNTLYAFIKKN